MRVARYLIYTWWRSSFVRDSIVSKGSAMAKSMPKQVKARHGAHNDATSDSSHILHITSFTNFPCTGSPLTHKLEWLRLNFTHSIWVVLRPVFCVFCFQSSHCLSLCTTDDWPRVRIIAISSAFAMIHSVRVAIFILALAKNHTKNYSSPVLTRCLSGIPSSALKWNVWARIFDEDNGWTLHSVVCVFFSFISSHLLCFPCVVDIHSVFSSLISPVKPNTPTTV